MIGALPSPIDPSLEGTLRDIAREARLVPLDDRRFPELVAAMAAAYNDDRMQDLRARDRLAARLGFWFPRDLPKMAGAVREAVAIGRWARSATLRVLDVGAGLGASHRGLARGLQGGTLDVLAVDDDREALGLAAMIAKKRPREGNVEIRLEKREASVAELVQKPPRGRFDTILFGQVLSELDTHLAPPERVELHAEQIATLIRECLAPNGLVAIVEPALRTRARHLQRVRTALIAKGLSIVAPCLHHERCPLLGREGDWCHEDLNVDLPEFLAPIAKKAGLRWEGLTFSYLLVGTRGPRLIDTLEPPRRERAVSGLLVTKGKKEIVLCGDPLRGEVPEADLLGPNGARIGRLDRATTETNQTFDELARGDIVRVGALDEKLRLGPDSTIEQLGEGRTAAP
ncbi:MAG: small ribosomal subunit Rsm22 family protein [Polyangiales bacterium]